MSQGTGEAQPLRKERDHAANAAPADQDRAGVIAPPPVIYAAGLGIGFALQAFLPSTSLPAALRWSLGGVLLLAGLVLAVVFFRTFRRAGTPADVYKPARVLVTTGPYRMSRHPAYLSLALIYLGIVFLTGALWVLLPFPVVLFVADRGLIAPEERYLERRFGGEYLRYKARTRRWL
jgi:protein-S-isoprenylcysteine O-methyltransferase Ste14